MTIPPISRQERADDLNDPQQPFRGSPLPKRPVCRANKSPTIRWSGFLMRTPTASLLEMGMVQLDFQQVGCQIADAATFGKASLGQEPANMIIVRGRDAPGAIFSGVFRFSRFMGFSLCSLCTARR